LKIKKLIRGLLSYVPVARNIIPKKGTHGSDDPYYCLKTFELHEKLLKEAGCNFPMESVGELGPGDSMGVGITALLNGTKKYFGLDAIEHSNIKINIEIFQSLIKLYEDRNVIFPENLKKQIENSIVHLNATDSMLRYMVPWWKEKPNSNSMDVIISTAVLEHIVPLEESYTRIFDLLKPGGYCSHIIDYAAHEFSKNWYEHWYYSDLLWRILMDGRIYRINRMPHSFHIKSILNAGFILEKEIVDLNNVIANINKINPTIRNHFNENDLAIQSAKIILKKPL